MVSVSRNLSSLVSTVTTRGDQNNDNLANISSLLNKTASLFANPNTISDLSTEEVEAVSIGVKQYGDIIFMHVSTLL